MDEAEKERKRIYMRQWKANNPDKVAGYNRAWYERNADKETGRKRSQYAANPDAYKAAVKRYRDRYPDRVKETLRQSNQRRKTRVMDAYGGTSCRCCGETTITFLTIDHVNGCTKEQRKKEGQGSQMYAYLIKNGFPPGFQVLCFNCNLGREANGGTCPHQLLRSA